MMYLPVVLLSALALAAGQKYTTKYDDVNVDEILKNDRLFNNYFNCVMDKGKCTVDALELKKHLPEALGDDCAQCTKKQRQGTEKVLKHIFDKRPEQFIQLEAKFDPEGKYRAKYSAKST